MNHRIKKGVKKITPKYIKKYHRRHYESREAQEQIKIKLDKILNQIEHSDNRLHNLQKIIAGVEHYQPTYGITGVVDVSARDDSRSRATVIESNIKPVPGKRIIDFGSSLGYFPFYFADRGAVTEGWESNPTNCEVARHVQAINGIQADFKTKELNNDTVKTIDEGAYDLGIILSVFHHIIRFNGLEYTQKLVKELLERIPVLVVELARKGEDHKLPWDKSQPENELAIFDLVKDQIKIKKIGEFPNHLSNRLRPMYLVENKKIVTVGSQVYGYESKSSQAYEDSMVPHSGLVRRYYHGKKAVVKEYQLSGKYQNENEAQIISEIGILFNLSNKNVYHAPKLIGYEIIPNKRARLALEKVEGGLLSEKKKPLKPSVVESVLCDIAKSLSDLEALGLHHNDVRSWNVILQNDNAWLIDYGLVSAAVVDSDKSAFLWLAHTALTGNKETNKQNKSELPDRELFSTPKLKVLYRQLSGATNTSFLKVYESLRN